MNMVSIFISTKLRSFAVAATAALAACTLAACGAPPGPAAQPSQPAPRANASSPLPEINGPRLAVTYDGGILILDAGDLTEVAKVELPGFLRINPAGDQRHLVVSTATGFQVLDTGVITEGHGDHNHYYGQAPTLTSTTFPAPKPGHAVVHHGRLALFSDETGTVQIVDPSRIADGTALRTYQSAHPHHGVAVPLHDEQLAVSVGDDNGRTGAQVVDQTGKVIASSNQCPDLHGEAAAADETVAFGCTNGMIIYRDGKFAKVTSPDRYGRMGNLSGHDKSPYILGDYKVDPDADLERPTRVAIIDSTQATMTLVKLPASYSFRSLARGSNGEALVLGTDGALHVIDPATATITHAIKTVAPWTEPLQWQEPRPTVRVNGAVAYVTEPATKKIHIVSLSARKVVGSVSVSEVPNEISTV